MRKERIMSLICNHFNVTLGELVTKSMKRDLARIVEGKQTAAYLLYRHTDLTYLQISEVVGWADKSNSYMARMAVRKRLTEEEAYQKKIKELESKIFRD